MKPNFALDLSHDGIGLVHRGKGGWALVGEVALDDPEMPNELAVLRSKAADLESGGFSCKLIIPASQLLFTSMTAAGPDNITREARIREGLEGLTPYNVDDLVFDWQPDPQDDAMVHVAVVARETLAEAEGFASEFDLNPISFVARPSGNFSGEAFFGPVAGSSVANGATITRDTSAVPELLGGTAAGDFGDQCQSAQPQQPDAPAKPEAPALPELAPFPPTPELPPETIARAPKDPIIPEPAATVEPSDPTPEATPPAFKPETSRDAPVASVETGDLGSSLDGGKISGIVPPPPPIPEPYVDAETPAFSSRRTDTADTPIAPVSNGADPEPVDVKVKPRLSFGVDRSVENGKDNEPLKVEPKAEPKPPAPPVHVPVTAPIAFGDDPALKPDQRADKANGKSRAGKSGERLSSAARKGASGLAAAAGGAAEGLKRKASQKRDERRREKNAPASAQDEKAKFPSLRKRAQSKTKDAKVTAVAPPPPRNTDKPNRPPNVRSREAESLTVFGARQTQQVGGKPKYLGFFLVLGLLLVMAVVAIWSMFFLNDNSAWLFPEREDPFEAAISTDPTFDVDESELDDINADLDDALNEPSSPALQSRTGSDPLTPEAAQARYAATGIWQRAPEPLTDPTTGDLDELYIASIDPATHAEDAIALPSSEVLAASSGRVSTTPPPPLGATFALDSNGLVRATPDGALTPEGIMVFAARPVLVPAPRPGSAASVEADELPQDTAVADPEAPTIRPRARPEGLIEGNERLQLGGRTRIELAALRPRARPDVPASVVNAIENPQADDQAAAIAAALQADNSAAGNPSTAAALVSPTNQAIATSIEPKHRPSGFSKIVSRAKPADGSDGTVVVAAASASQSVVPKIPTRTSVAKQATIKNAINLRKVSLIGIYGSASARRALVRLPSGRYVKVGAGSRLDGGKVVSISTTKLVYKKGSRSITLQVVPFS